MTPKITPEQRRYWAEKLGGLNEQYLYQCLTGRRDMNPGEARRIERDSGGVITRQMLCQKTWQEIWPELALQQESRALCATETIAMSDDALPPVCDLPPIVVAPAAPAWDGIDRRGPVARPVPPDLDRRAALAAALAGGGV